MNANFEMIADGLAEQGYAVCDEFLTAAEVAEILALEDFEQAHEKFQNAGIGKKQSQQINEAIRGDYIQWLDRTTCPKVTRVYLDRLDQLIVQF